jgi:hypothetical protein
VLLSQARAPLQGVQPRTNRRPGSYGPLARLCPTPLATRRLRDYTPFGASIGGGRQPSWTSFPFSASGAGDPLLTGPAEPATFRPQRFSRSRRFPPPGTSPGLFHPGNALGIRPSGLSPSEEPDPSRGPFLSCRSPERAAREGHPPELGFRDLLPPEVRTVKGFLGPPDGRYPPGLHPSKALPSSTAGSASRPFLSCASRKRPEGLLRRRFRVSASRGLGISRFRRCRPFWGLPPLRRRQAFRSDGPFR